MSGIRRPARPKLRQKLRDSERLAAHHSFVNRAAMARVVLPRGNESLQRCVDIIKMDVGDEAVDSGVNARRIRSMNVRIGGNEVGQETKIGEAPRIGGVRLIPADALEIIALKIEFTRLGQSLVGEARMLAH
jgi:hypothetical protein